MAQPATAQPIVVQTGGSSTGKIITGAIIVGGIIYIGKKAKDYFDKENQKKQLAIDQNTTVKPAPGKKLFDLNGKPIASANLATIAADLENALSFPVDQQRVLRVFKTTPFGKVPDLETFYLNKYSENLKDLMIKKLSDANWISIKYWFR